MNGGALSFDWASAFAAVPRAAFLPDVMWPWDMEAGCGVTVDRVVEPERWRAYADADCPVVTRWDDGDHGGTGPGESPTGSVSMPSVVFRMLRALDGSGVPSVEEFTGGRFGPQRFVLGLRVPDCVQVEAEKRDGARSDHGRFGLTVTLEGERAWLDDPGQAWAL